MNRAAWDAERARLESMKASAGRADAQARRAATGDTPPSDGNADLLHVYHWAKEARRPRVRRALAGWLRARAFLGVLGAGLPGADTFDVSMIVILAADELAAAIKAGRPGAASYRGPHVLQVARDLEELAAALVEKVEGLKHFEPEEEG